jgi:hypothetical protein
VALLFLDEGAQKVEEKQEDLIQKLMSQTHCDNEFRCLKSGSKKLCGAKIVGDGQLVDCSQGNCDACIRGDPEKCGYRTPFGFGHFCVCPIRIYLAAHPDMLPQA